MDDQIPHVVKIQRLEALIALQNQITLEINHVSVGSVLNVLVEGRSPKDRTRWSGLNDQGKTVNFTSVTDDDLVGETVPVRALSAHLWGFAGEHIVPRVRDFRLESVLNLATV